MLVQTDPFDRRLDPDARYHEAPPRRLRLKRRDLRRLRGNRRRRARLRISFAVAMVNKRLGRRW